MVRRRRGYVVIRSPRRWCGFGLLAAMLAAISPAEASPLEDAYISGYAAALLDSDSRLRGTAVSVHDGMVIVERADLGTEERRRAMAILGKIPNVKQVIFAAPEAPARAPAIAAAASPAAPAQPIAQPAAAQPASSTGEGLILIPGRKLFEPLIADPRTPHFGASFIHLNNASELESGAAVSFGESIPLLETDAPLIGGQMQVGLLAALFSLFDAGSKSEDLIDSDYLVGVPVSWRLDRWSAQLRYLHQSSHLGDELLLRPSHSQRVNLSFEQADLIGSYQLDDEFRLYGGGGAILRSEPHRQHLLAQLGSEYGAAWRVLYGYLRPVAGIDLQARESQRWQPDLSLRAGVELDSPFPLGRKLQLMLEYYNGKSPWGQFLQNNVEYYGIGTHFYF
jgi:hypothetical protein